MLSLKDFLAAIDAANTGRSDSDISRSAGAGPNTVSSMRRGRVPSLEMAARIADAVGLELIARRKGESLDPYAHRAAIVVVGALDPAFGDIRKEADYASELIERSYGSMEGLFRLVPATKREALYESIAAQIEEHANRLKEMRDKVIAEGATTETVDNDPRVLSAVDTLLLAVNGIVGACKVFASEIAAGATAPGGREPGE